MAKHVRIGVVGAGFAAHFHLASYAKVYGEDFEIAGIYGRTKDKAAHLAKDFKIPKVYDTYEQMLAGLGLDTNSALARIGGIVHFLEVRGTPVPEAAGVQTLLQGASRRAASDDELLREAEKTFDLLYDAYSDTREATRG